MKSLFYRMVGDTVVPVGRWPYADDDPDDRRIAVTFLPQTDAAGQPLAERVKVSTVFLCYDYNNRGDDDAPILFETMIFGGPLDGEQERYADYWSAYYGHRRWVDRAIQALDDDPEGPK